MSLTPSASIEATLTIPEGTSKLSYTALDVEQIIKSVQDDAAGAVAVFIGEIRPRG